MFHLEADSLECVSSLSDSLLATDILLVIQPELVFLNRVRHRSHHWGLQDCRVLINGLAVMSLVSIAHALSRHRPQVRQRGLGHLPLRVTFRGAVSFLALQEVLRGLQVWVSRLQPRVQGITVGLRSGHHLAYGIQGVTSGQMYNKTLSLSSSFTSTNC